MRQSNLTDVVSVRIFDCFRDGVEIGLIRFVARCQLCDAVSGSNWLDLMYTPKFSLVHYQIFGFEYQANVKLVKISLWGK